MTKNYSLTAVILFFFLLSSQIGNAQDFGVKLGPNFHSIAGEDVEDQKLRVGFHLGAFGEFQMSDDIFLRPELLYSLEGSKSEREILGETTTSTTNYNYISIPVMGRYYATEKVYLEAGPSIGLFLGGKTVTDDDSQDLDMENYNGLELAAEVGGGLAITDNISVGLRGDIGLTGVWDLDDDSDFSNFTNIGLRLSGAYTF